MTIEKLAKRIAYVAKCKCGRTDIRPEKEAPKSRLCACGEWVDFVRTEVTGPDQNL